MSVFRAVFVLCSLLTPSQGLGIMPLVAKVDVDGKHMEERGFISFLRPVQLFMSFDHAQKNRSSSRSIQQ